MFDDRKLFRYASGICFIVMAGMFLTHSCITVYEFGCGRGGVQSEQAAGPNCLGNWQTSRFENGVFIH